LPPVTSFTCHVTAVFAVPVTVAVNCCVPFTGTLGVDGETVTVIAGAAVIVTVALSNFVLSATETAVTVTATGFGIVAGAVYNPPAVIVPTVASPPAVPLTSHVTAVFAEFATVAVNCCVPFTATLGVFGETVTVTAGGAVTVTDAVPLLVLSACETAVTVTVAGAGTDAGAV
jgi:hypothetical protein